MPQGSVALLIDAIMDNGAVWPGARYSFKADVFQLASVMAKAFELLTRRLFHQRQSATFSSSQHKNRQTADAIANMGGAGALDLDLVLDGFGQGTRVARHG